MQFVSLQNLGPRPHIALDLFHQAREQFRNRPLVYDLIRQSGLKISVPCEPLMAADLGPALDSQEKCHLTLGK